MFFLSSSTLCSPAEKKKNRAVSHSVVVRNKAPIDLAASPQINLAIAEKLARTGIIRYSPR